MDRTTRIITVGVQPAWDVTCRGQDIQWGGHGKLGSQTLVPAGKALNINKALAWMKVPSVAAGLWGTDDLSLMKKGLGAYRKSIRVKMVPAAGATRRNITVIDSARNREMHLRAPSELATPKSLADLHKTLMPMAGQNAILVFAGSLPGGTRFTQVKKTIDMSIRKKTRVAVDTSGPALKKLVRGGGLWLIKPNVEELCDVTGGSVPNRIKDLGGASQKLLGSVQMILLSRGAQGAMLITQEGIWSGVYSGQKQTVSSTVGCGDFLLAGFLAGIQFGQSLPDSLKQGIICATARAYGLFTEKSFDQLTKKLPVNITFRVH